MSVIEAKALEKSFPGVKALSELDFVLERGEVHGLVGENGAGKSTFIKLLGGVYQPDAGTIVLDGDEVHFRSPLEARQRGITIIFQELSLVPDLNVAENIYLGTLPHNRGIVDRKSLYEQADEVLTELNCPFSSRDYVGLLSTGKKQMVEIARALARKSKVVVFDEPTASLGAGEIAVLFEKIDQLRKSGTSIIYISHKLDEIFEITDRVSVMRDGKRVSTTRTEDTTEDEVVAQMIGRNIENYYSHLDKDIGAELLRVEHLTQDGVFGDITFGVRRGEILGFYGLVGAGRSELMRSIMGIDGHDSGTVFLEENPILIKHPATAVGAGIALVPEDRKEEGLILGLDIRKNMNLVRIREESAGPFLKTKAMTAVYHSYVETLGIKAASPKVQVRNLSGGNQQKVVLAKWLSVDPRVLILDEPTRGIDVGAKSEIHRIIARLAKEGMAIIVVSSEMPEIIGLCDRVVTMRDGMMTGEFSGKDITEENLISAITRTEKSGGATA